MTQTTKPEADNRGCAGADETAASGACSYADYRRVRFFHGMPLDHQMLLAEQGYHVARRRQLNRLLHGSGIVCGLSMTRTERKWVIQVEPGLALDPCGRELDLARPMAVDLEEWCRCAQRDEDNPCPEDDPTDKRDLWIALCYQERPSDPIPSYDLSGCCESPGCEYSRIHEGVCIKILKNEPRCDVCECYSQTKGAEVAGAQPDAEEKSALYCCGTPPCCPACGDCVVLGRVTIDCCTGEMNEVDWKKNCLDKCRKYILTPHLLRDVICRLPLKENLFAELLSNPYRVLCAFEGITAENTNQMVNHFTSPGIDDRLVAIQGAMDELRKDLTALQNLKASAKTGKKTPKKDS